MHLCVYDMYGAVCVCMICKCMYMYVCERGTSSDGSFTKAEVLAAQRASISDVEHDADACYVSWG